MPKRLLYVLAFIAGCALIIQLVLPKVVSELVAQGMVNQTGSDNVSVKVEKSPALLMLGGSFDAIKINAVNAKTDKVTFGEVNAALNDVQLDINKLLSKRLIALKSVGNVELVATITEAELARLISQSVKGAKNVVVMINPDKVQAKSQLSLGSFAAVNVTIEGKIAVDSQRIKFVTERVILNNSPVGSLGGMAAAEIPLVENKKLPFDVSVRDIKTEKGKVLIYADNKDRQ